MPGFISWRWIELRKLAMIIDGIFARLFNTVIHFHNGRLVSASVTIIGSRKDRHHCSIVLPLVAFHHQLVRTGNKVQTVNVRELLRNVLAKCVTRSPRGNSPTATVVMRAKQFVSTIYFLSDTCLLITTVVLETYRSSGSDQTKSHMGPSWGTSWTRSKSRA